MNTKKLKKQIVFHYACHGVGIKMKHADCASSDRVIFRVKLEPGTKAKDVFSYANDVQMALELGMLQPFQEGYKLYIAVSERVSEGNSLM